MRASSKNLADLFKAKDPAIYIQTYEEAEAVEEICEIVRKNSELSGKIPPKVYVYTRPGGLVELDITNPNKYDAKSVVKGIMNHTDAINFAKNLQHKIDNTKNDILSMIQSNGQPEAVSTDYGPAVFIFKDLHLFMADKDVLRSLRDLKEIYRNENYVSIVAISPILELPPELEKMFTLYNMPLMNSEEIKAKLEPLLFRPLKTSEEDAKTIVDACVGLTNREIDRAIYHSLVKNDKRSVSALDIHEEKMQIIKKNGALDFIIPSHTLDDLGGCDNFKEWIKKVKESMTDEARDYGIPEPKGCMLVGVPGTSKTVSAEIMASYMNIPLLSLDMAKIMGSFVGQSEQQISNALRIAKAVSPCILLIDECEKGFAGVQSSASCDSGTLSRVMGQLLTFLNNDNTGVITIMTSNDVTQLPPELTRSGRIDAQWVFDLPNKYERKQIIDIYMNKTKLECSSTTMQYLVDNTENFTGAELKSVISDMLKNTYYRQKIAGKKEISRIAELEDVKDAVANTVTVYRTSFEKIENFRACAKNRYLNASKTEVEMAKGSEAPSKPMPDSPFGTVPRKKPSFINVHKEQ